MLRRTGAPVTPAVLVVVLACLSLGLSGCDGTRSRGARRLSAGPLIVYTGLPMVGPSAGAGEAVLRGERLALEADGDRVGRYRLQLRVLDDATVRAGGADPGQTTADAELAAGDPRTIGYIGELDSGATAVSLPLLNRADIPQISPLSTALGLTRGGPEASPGEPLKYYPSATRTFARVVPNDSVQSAVQATLQRADRCTRVYALNDDEVEGRDAVDSVIVADRADGIDVVGSAQFQPVARTFASLAVRVARARPDCVVFSALVQDDAAAVTDAVGRAVPGARLFATLPLAQPAFASPALGGVARSLDPRLVITSPTLAPSDYPTAGRRFEARFRARYGRGAGAGIWGEAAMSLLLDAIRRACDGGRTMLTRARVLDAIFTTRRLSSVLGVYSIDAAGDTSISRFGVYRVVRGRLVFWKALRG